MFVVKITKVTSNGAQGSADFLVEEMNTETRGTLKFRITKGNGCKNVSVLDPFGGLNPRAYEILVGLLKFELGRQGLI